MVLTEPQKQTIAALKVEIKKLQDTYFAGVKENYFSNNSFSDGVIAEAQRHLKHFMGELLGMYRVFIYQNASPIATGSSLPSYIGAYGWRSNVEQVPEGILEFNNFIFHFPFEWDKICPLELQALAVKFDSCNFVRGFYFSGIGSEANNLIFINGGVAENMSIQNIKLKGLYFSGFTAGSIDLRNVIVENYIRYLGGQITKFAAFNLEIKSGLIINQTQLYDKTFLSKCSICVFSILGATVYAKKTANQGRFRSEFKGKSRNTFMEDILQYDFIIDECDFTNSVNMSGTNFKASVLVKNVHFREEAIFNNCTFENTTCFEHVTFHKEAKFHAAALHQDTDLSGAKFLDFTSDSAHRDYSTLKHHMTDLNAEIEAHRFHAYELKSRYNTVLKKWDVEKISSWVFKAICDYHQSLWRPFVILFALGIAMSYVYTFGDAVACVEHVEDKNRWLTAICRNVVLRNTAFSFQQTIWPLGFITQNPIWNLQTAVMKFVSLFQVFLDGLVMFMLILGIRKRFKL